MRKVTFVTPARFQTSWIEAAHVEAFPLFRRCRIFHCFHRSIFIPLGNRYRSNANTKIAASTIRLCINQWIREGHSSGGISREGCGRASLYFAPIRRKIHDKTDFSVVIEDIILSSLATAFSKSCFCAEKVENQNVNIVLDAVFPPIWSVLFVKNTMYAFNCVKW